jgi:hypothetical protein
MAASVRDQVIAAVVAALNAPADKPCLTYRTRVAAFSAAELPAMVVYPVTEDITRASQNVVKRDLSLRVEVHVEGEPPQDAAIDPLLSYVVKTLYADPTLDGLIKFLGEDKVQWSFDPSDVGSSFAALDLQVVYTSATTDPAQKAVQ